MIYTKTKVKLTVLGLAATTLLIFGATNIQAQDTSDNYPPIVQKIAEKFGLKESEVQVVFDQQRIAHHEEMQVKFEARLASLVTNGTLTQVQKEAILAKHKEMQEKREENKDKVKDMSKEERKAFFESQKKELEAWADQNNIDLKVIPFFGHMKGMRIKGSFGR